MLILLIVLITLSSVSCSSSRGSKPNGIRSQYINPSKVNEHSGIGIEPNDIKTLSDKMVRSILINSAIANGKMPRVIVDSKFFVNESNHNLNLNSIVDQFRINLLKAARNKIIFLSRENIDLVEDERELKSNNLVDDANGQLKKIKGADYRLVGRITSESRYSGSSGIRSNYYHFAFEVIDLEDDSIAWGDNFDIQKQGADDTVYR